MGTVHSVDWSTTARGRSRLFTFLQIHFFFFLFFYYILLLLLGTHAPLFGSRCTHCHIASYDAIHLKQIEILSI